MVLHRLPVRLLGCFWATALGVTVLGMLSIRYFGVARALGAQPKPELLTIWTRFDGGWYYQIATRGYFYDPDAQSAIVFWPSYPMAIRAVASLGLDIYLAGALLTLAATSIAIVVLRAWQRDYAYPDGVTHPDGVAIGLGVVAWLAYPFAWFLYGAVYSDALFAAVAVTAFWLLERDRPVAAGLIGIVATAGRPFGWAVTVGLAVRAVERQWRRRHETDLTLADLARRPGEVLRCVRPRDLTVGISGLGTFSFLGYLWLRFGSPWLFITGEAQWGIGVGPGALLKRPFWNLLLHGWTPSPLTALICIAQAIIGLAVLAAVVPVRRRYGLGMAAFVALSIGLPLIGTRDFLGIGRYALSAFPVFTLVGFHLRPHLRLARAGLAASGLSMVFLSTLFARGFYLS